MVKNHYKYFNEKIANFATIYVISAQVVCNWSFFCSSTVVMLWLVGEFHNTVLCQQQYLPAHAHVHTTTQHTSTCSPCTNAFLEAYLTQLFLTHVLKFNLERCLHFWIWDLYQIILFPFLNIKFFIASLFYVKGCRQFRASLSYLNMIKLEVTCKP